MPPAHYPAGEFAQPLEKENLGGNQTKEISWNMLPFKAAEIKFGFKEISWKMPILRSTVQKFLSQKGWQ